MITATGLVKRHGRVTALNGVDVSVDEGSVLAVLGPNGAGKSTLVRILATLSRPDAGSVHIGGADALRDPVAVRRMIGLTGQYASVDDDLTGRENLELIGRLLGLRRPKVQIRAAELLQHFDLTEAGDRQVKTYSGGMRRRVDLAAGLVGEPRVLFLDEPSTGLDPRSRLNVWQAIRELTARGVTVLLTTQYLEEADALAERICVLEGGRVVAEGTPLELKQTTGAQNLHEVYFSLTEPARSGSLHHEH